MVRQADDPSTELLNIFRSNPKRYFTFDEISKELESRGVKLSKDRLHKILDTLEVWRRVQREGGVGSGRYRYYATTEFGVHAGRNCGGRAR